MNHNNPGKRRHIPQHSGNKPRMNHTGGGRGGQRQSVNSGSSAVSLNKIYDSAGPDVKIKGTAAHIYERYVTLARDATSAGDRVLSENYTQHAEHYLRIINAVQEQLQTMYRTEAEAAETNAETEFNEAHTEAETEPREIRQNAVTPREENRNPIEEETQKSFDRPKRPLNIPFLKRNRPEDDSRSDRPSRPQQNQPRHQERQPAFTPQTERPLTPTAESANADSSAGGRRGGTVRRRIVAKPADVNGETPPATDEKE